MKKDNIQETILHMRVFEILSYIVGVIFFYVAFYFQDDKLLLYGLCYIGLGFITAVIKNYYEKRNKKKD